MDQRYLLTYDVYIKELMVKIQTYCWFEHEEDMQEFIEINDNITVIDKIEIMQCKNL